MVLLNKSGELTGYRERTYGLVRSILNPLVQIHTAVDVGAGEGWFAKRLMEEGIAMNCIPIEVTRRTFVETEPILYDGKTLPFTDSSVPLVYAIDVIHHAENPFELLDEIARISSKWILVKDHTYSNSLGQITLKIMDELGNRRFGIHSPGKYQHKWSWLEHLKFHGFSIHTMQHPAVCHSGILGIVTNRLQFIALLEKKNVD